MKKILIVVDMQNDFITGSLGTKEAQKILPQVVKKIEAYQRKGEQIFYTRDTHSQDYLSTQEGQKLPVSHCIQATWGWELAAPIQELVAHDNVIVDKPTFGSVKLAEQIKTLSERELLELEIVGLCTDICVVSNALLIKAYCPELSITVDASCCAGVTPETHTSALTTLKMCQISVINE